MPPSPKSEELQLVLTSTQARRGVLQGLGFRQGLTVSQGAVVGAFLQGCDRVS